MQLVVVAFWKGAENSHGDDSDDQRTSQGLHKDGVLDLPKSRLLDPDFAVKDFTDEVAFLVLGDPGFVFVAVGAAKGVEGAFAHVHGGLVVVFDEKFPWAEMAMVHSVEHLEDISNGGLAWLNKFKEETYDTHALPGSDECCDTNHESNGREYPPASTSVTEGDENGTDDTTQDAGNSEATGKDHTGAVAVANGPSDEVGVGLVTQRPLNRVNNEAEGCRVGSVGQGVQKSRPLLCWEI